MSEQTMAGETLTETGETVLAVLRRHGIGAFNGSQVACAHCRRWMKTDEYHRHLAQIVERWLTTATPSPTPTTTEDDR